MDRLRTGTCVAVLLLLLLAGCAGRDHSVPQEQNGEDTASSSGPDYQTLQPASAAVRQALQAPAAVFESQAGQRELAAASREFSSLLGPLPQAKASRHPSAVEQTTYLFGNESFEASANAVDAGGSKILSTAGNELCWAVYEMSGIQASDNLSSLYVESSAHSFQGRRPGIWLCFANYETGRWQMISRITQTNYRRDLTTTAPYITEDGNFYFALIVTDSQEATVDRVGLGVSSIWTRLVLDDGPLSGWTPAVVLDTFASVHVAYANHGSGDPQYGVCLGTTDPLVLDNWAFSAIDTQGAGEANWLDIIMDPVFGRPSVSYVYTGLSDPGGNSQVVLANLVDHPSLGLIWANYGFFADGAEYSSLDYHAPQSAYGFVCAVRNENSAPKKAYDLEYRFWNLGSPWDPTDNGEVAKLSGFGENLVYPHLRYQPGTGESAIVANGAELLYETSPDVWLPIFDEAGSGDFGSLAWMPAGVSSATMMGTSYAKEATGESRLFYVAFDSSQLGVAEEVDSLPATGGAWVGGSSQLAYLRNGEPVIAYTVSTGTKVQVKYAHKAAGVWKTEVVCPDAGNATEPQAVLVDIAAEPSELFFDPTGRIAIVYNPVTDGQTRLEIAVKNEEL